MQCRYALKFIYGHLRFKKFSRGTTPKLPAGGGEGRAGGGCGGMTPSRTHPQNGLRPCATASPSFHAMPSLKVGRSGDGVGHCDVPSGATPVLPRYESVWALSKLLCEAHHCISSPEYPPSHVNCNRKNTRPLLFLLTILWIELNWILLSKYTYRYESQSIDILHALR